MDDFSFTEGLQGHFKFLNGDQYYGEYAVDRMLKRVFRHGCGTYVTSTCCVYKGRWEYDKLECAYIKYPIKQQYCGRLNSEGSYDSGTYDFDDCCKLHVDLEGTGHLEFQDQNDTFWNAELLGSTIVFSNEGVQ